jgi:polyisoprenyl-teichoic acid--peptidoglycan teichoic acid transferase
MAPGVRIRRARTLLGLTLVAPGSAQLVAGDASVLRARAARTVLRIWAGFLVALVLLAIAWLIHREFVLGLFTHQSVLRGLALLLLAAGVGWPLLTLDAWHLGGVRHLPVRSRRQLTVIAGLLALLTCAVPIAAGRRVWAGADLLGGVFGSSTRSTVADGRYNVLLLGGDAGPDRVGTRPDSVNLASIDADTGRTALISLPRNLQNVPFPAGSLAAKALPRGWSCGDTCLLNAIYTWGSQKQNQKYFPGVKDPGAEAMKQAVQAITGLKVNYYVLIDLQGFRSMIDAVGGINIDVTARVPIGGETSPISGWIEPGKQHLNGFHALWYARSRTITSDYDRMARQRCVMTAMVNQLDPGTLLSHFQQIAAAGPKVVSTDIPAAELPKFITLGGEAKRRKIESLQFVPPLIVPHHPNYALIRNRVAALIADSEHGTDTESTPALSATPSPAASKSTSASGAKPTAAGAAGPSAAATPPAAVDVRQVCKPA